MPYTTTTTTTTGGTIESFVRRILRESRELRAQRARRNRAVEELSRKQAAARGDIRSPDTDRQ
jgi:hypothetical protein